MDTKLVLLLVLGIVAIAWADPKTACRGATHNLILGKREPGDRLLDNTRPNQIKGRDSIVQWPRMGKREVKITRIEVLDQYHDGSGGCATLVSGGLGSDNVKLHLQAQPGRNFDFRIRIYGK
uniref:Secreted venom protein family 3 protein n=1 Tax=Pristhesancus plagipennis TaxID=1955184 RepID=A0A2K8JLX5_PRIPG|nr:secreted venom protein family 3 protein [Pristhesancus plagipennis]